VDPGVLEDLQDRDLQEGQVPPLDLQDLQNRCLPVGHLVSPGVPGVRLDQEVQWVRDDLRFPKDHLHPEDRAPREDRKSQLNPLDPERQLALGAPEAQGAPSDQEVPLTRGGLQGLSDR